MALPSGIVDIHVHIQPWDQLRPQVREAISRGRQDLREIEEFRRDAEAFVRHLDALGIARVGLVNYPAPRIMGFGPSTNDFVAAYRDLHPDRFLAWGGWDPSFPGEPRRQMERLLDELRLDGIKVHPPHQGFSARAYQDEVPGLRAVYEACEERGVPVMVHTGTSTFPGARSRLGNPLDCDDVAVDFPGLTLVLAHCGRPLWYEEAFFVARRHPRVHVDLSGIPPKQLPEKLPRLELLGEKVLWGTDWPSPGVRDLRSNAEVFWAQETWSEAFRRGVLRDHAGRLFPPRKAGPGNRGT